MTHETFMARCIQLAKQGLGSVASNPMVGSVLVYENEIIGEGYHRQYGQAHAEINCLHAVPPEKKHLIPKATLYVSLEPCCHQGKTPACTQAIQTAGIQKVVVAAVDPYAKVNGEGIRQLQHAGIHVTYPVLSAEAEKLNTRFFTFHQKRRPYIILKWAQSQDGFMGTHHKPTPLSNALVNNLVHQWRSQEMGIWAGYNTLLTDNPQLNVRHVQGNNPIRIFYDAQLNLPNSLHVFDGQQSSICYNNLNNKVLPHVEFKQVNPEHWMTSILDDLYARNIISVLVEGGSKLLTQFIQKNLWDEMRVIHTPIMLKDGVKAPLLPEAITPYESIAIDDNKLYLYRHS